MGFLGIGCALVLDRCDFTLAKPGLSSKRNAPLLMGLERRRAAGMFGIGPTARSRMSSLSQDFGDEPEPLLEISVETLEAALAAERGGATALNSAVICLLAALHPARISFARCERKLAFPFFHGAPTGGRFRLLQRRFAEMKRAISAAKESGVAGVVLGILTKEGRVDLRRTQQLTELARPLPVTYHRAFDEAADRTSLEDVIESGAKEF